MEGWKWRGERGKVVRRGGVNVEEKPGGRKGRGGEGLEDRWKWK